MRSTIERTIATALLVAGLIACSSTPGAAPSTPAPTTPAPAAVAAVPAVGTPAATTVGPETTAPVTSTVELPPAPADDRAGIELTFRDYNAALVARNFAAACSFTAPQASQALISALAAQGANVSTCEEAFAAVYAVPQAALSLDEAARSARITDATVSGDIATVTYAGEANGLRSEGLTNKMQRTAGRWQLLGNDA